MDRTGWELEAAFWYGPGSKPADRKYWLPLQIGLGPGEVSNAAEFLIRKPQHFDFTLHPNQEGGEDHG